MKIVKLSFFAVLMLASAACPAEEAAIKQSMTVEQAYRAIPHERTRFDAATADMAAQEKEFLDTFFSLADFAVAEKMGTMIAITRGQDEPSHYDEILGRLAALQVPPKLAVAHRLVSQAISEQKIYLKRWKAAGGRMDMGDDLVESAHQKLIAAYNELMRLYPQENSHNRQAFFNHLCALDFK